eukprot:SAG22_NODE_980_length_6173_cov_5.884261_5_plen_78_part_00
MQEQIKADAEADDGIVPMIRRMFRNRVYWSYLYFKAPASISFALPYGMLAYYVQYAIMDNNPNLQTATIGCGNQCSE